MHALETEGCLVAMKGAPERILERCSTILLNGNDEELTDLLRSICDKACLMLAEQGEDVLLITNRPLKLLINVRRKSTWVLRFEIKFALYTSLPIFGGTS